MRFFPKQHPRQVYKELYRMTLEELEGLNHSYGPEFMQLGMQQAQEERNIAEYQYQIDTLNSQRMIINPIDSPQIETQITTLVLAIKVSETVLETIQAEVTDLANELRKVNGMLEQKRRENIQPQPEEYASYDSLSSTSQNSP